MSLDFISLETIQEFAHQYGYWAVFLNVLLENIGVPLPGETVVIISGFLAGSGEMNYWFVLIDAIAGAAIGGSLGYWVGFYGGWPLLLRLGRLFRIQEAQLVAIKTRFKSNAIKAIFLGRFLAFLRIFVGPMAGIAGIPYGEFVVYNAAGAALWASVMVTLSYFIGQLVPLEQLITWLGQFALVALGMVIAWATIPPWLEARKMRKCQPLAEPDSEPQSTEI